MGWRVGKQSHKAKSVKTKPRISGFEELGLLAPLKARPELSMEEIRRQGRILAGVGIGQTNRSQPSVHTSPASKAAGARKTVPRNRRRTGR